MKVAYLSSSILPSRTANSVHVMKMSQAIANNGHEVTLIAPNKPDKEEKNIKDIYQFYGVEKVFEVKKISYPNIRFIRSFGYALFSLFALFKIKPDLVYGRNLLGCYLSSFFFVTSFEAHLPMESRLSVLILKSLIKRKKFKNLVVISAALKKIILQQLPKDIAVNVVVAHDGADEVADFSDTVLLEGEPNRINIGYVGHLYPGRGVELIFQCAEQLHNLNFHLVGGNDKDIHYWKCLYKEKKLENVFFYGFVPPASSIRYRNSFDVLIAPYAKTVTISGGVGDTSKFMSPLKIFEYMSHKKAIVASDLPVLREILSDKNALLCAPEDVNEWIEAFDKLQDESFRDYLATNAYNDFMKEYTWLNRARGVL